MKLLVTISIILSAIGAINWGLVGAINFDLVAALFGHLTVASRVIYIIIGVSGLILLGSLGNLINYKTELVKK